MQCPWCNMYSMYVSKEQGLNISDHRTQVLELEHIYCHTVTLYSGVKQGGVLSLLLFSLY